MSVYPSSRTVADRTETVGRDGRGQRSVREELMRDRQRPRGCIIRRWGEGARSLTIICLPGPAIYSSAMAAIPGFSMLSPPQDTNMLGFPSLSPDDPSDQANAPGADPASSLRQAALLTLRSRRKPHTGSDLLAGLPSRPTRATASSIVLDYGQDEPSSAPPSSVAPPAARPPSALPAPVSAHVPLSAPPHTPVQKVAPSIHAAQEDITMREEGEISDNEGPPSPPQPPPRRSPPKETASVPKPSRNMPPSGLVSSSPHSTFLHPASISQPPTAKTDQTFSQPPTPRTPPRPSLVERLAPVSPISIKSDTFQLENPAYLVDANHVRPGLNSS